MAAIENQLNFQQSHYQKQSPLFGGIPGEIRNKIFVYSLVQYEDDGAAYPENSYWYRPGFKGPKKSSSSLLRTCKLAYLEGQKVYLHELEWAFWFSMSFARLDCLFCDTYQVLSLTYDTLRPWAEWSLGRRRMHQLFPQSLPSSGS